MTKCSNCNGEMCSNGFVRFQLGEANILFPNTGNIVAGSLQLELKTCSLCGKVDFYNGRGSAATGGKTRCKNCGNVHDKVKCPRCQQS